MTNVFSFMLPLQDWNWIFSNHFVFTRSIYYTQFLKCLDLWEMSQRASYFHKDFTFVQNQSISYLKDLFVNCSQKPLQISFKKRFKKLSITKEALNCFGKLGSRQNLWSGNSALFLHVFNQSFKYAFYIPFMNPVLYSTSHWFPFLLS